MRLSGLGMVATVIAGMLIPTHVLSETIKTTICISDNPGNNRCPINDNWLNCHPGDAQGKAKELCAVTQPDGTKKALSYVITDGPQGGGGPCGWHMLNLTCILP